MARVPDAYAAWIAEQLLDVLGERRISPEEAELVGRQTVAAACRDGWRITARPRHRASRKPE
ncbi:hypothetical protein [Streptomyces sp. NPDC095602]|uniref:hypothetical protein n=1 Tax=Streptomyces sp. NPDC095602 TaxID=3155819 RepID=UPI0033348DEB